MLNPRLLKKMTNYQKDDEKKQDKDDKSGYDEKSEDDEKDEGGNARHDENHEMHEIVEVNNDTSKADNMADENTSVRRSSRPRKQRMKIDEEEIEDCDDENDPDYVK